MTLISFYKEREIPVTMETLERVSTIFHLYNLPVSSHDVGSDAIMLRMKDLTEINPRELFVRAALK